MDEQIYAIIEGSFKIIGGICLAKYVGYYFGNKLWNATMGPRIRHLEELHKIGEDCNNKGNELRKEGKLEEAIKCYDEAINKVPGYVWSYTNKGDALYLQGNLDEAKKSYFNAIKINPSLENQILEHIDSL
jgi:tetratricopeptide (TPR) repeat protein